MQDVKKQHFQIHGGCNIGARPIDLHIDNFKKMGIEVTENEEQIICNADHLKSAKIKLKFPSVGATENIILASIYAKGTTYILNAAKEPEIKDLANCLNKMGAKVYGAGTGKITIIGVSKLHKCIYKVMPDRIEAGTYLAMSAITGGTIRINNSNPNDLIEVLYKLKELGCKISISKNTIFLVAPKKLKSTNIKTQVYPGFPTDMQPIFTSLLNKAEGISRVEENIFENRFLFCDELNKMGASIDIEKNTIIIKGPANLNGAIVSSNDLRGGAALVTAALAANGKTEVKNAKYILRGYEDLTEKMTSLGATIKLIK